MKKIDELKQSLATVKDEVRSLNEANKVEEAEAKLAELRNINKQIEIQTELDAQEIQEVEVKMENREVKNNELEIRTVFTKAIQGKSLTTEERALVQSAVNADGGFLVPKDVANDINQLKRQYKSAKDIVGVIPVSTEAGSFVVEDLSTMTDLINFDDSTTGLAEQQPKFKDVQYKVVNYGAITPIAKSFLQDETANFLNYLNGYFAKKAIRTENTKIFAELKNGKTAKPVTTMASLKKLINVEIDPAIKEVSVIAMNQDAFNFLDAMADSQGRPLFQQNPVDATQLQILGLPVHVFSNAELPTVATKAPIFIGALSEGVKFFDRGVYEVAISQEAGFKQNQVVARVVERFDVKQNDASAYVLAEVTV
ncbi:phage major capsid protein [Peribacillus frigoritolerans]|nr:phage major capsid protein [Peribacillus frigoritolerans]